MMRVRFWGTRGSLPVALTAADVRAKLVVALKHARGRPLETDADIERCIDAMPFEIAGTFGGSSPCVEIEPGGDEFVVCDLGSGLRAFGQAALARHGPTKPCTYHVFVSHVHWDHIMGLPFFTPAYIPGNRVIFYGGHPGLEAALRRQMDVPSFPIDFSYLRADLAFVRLEPGVPVEVAGMTVHTKLQRHAGDSYGYRFERGGKSIVYTTDSEHKLADPEEARSFAEFFRAADLVIFDAMYSLADAISVKADWGHSSNITGVELCQSAGVKHLCLFHHEPANDDAAIAALLADARRYEEITRLAAPLAISAAYDGLVIAL